MNKIVINFDDIKKMKDLTAQDFILFHIIKSMIKNDQEITLKQLSDISNIPYNNINRNLNRLVNLKYIKIKKDLKNLNKKNIIILK